MHLVYAMSEVVLFCISKSASEKIVKEYLKVKQLHTRSFDMDQFIQNNILTIITFIVGSLQQ